MKRSKSSGKIEYLSQKLMIATQDVAPGDLILMPNGPWVVTALGPKLVLTNPARRAPSPMVRAVLKLLRAS